MERCGGCQSEALDVCSHMDRITYQEADEENVPYAIGLPIEEIMDPEPTIYHVNAVPYQSQTRIQTRPQIQYIPHHPNNRRHRPLPPTQEPELQEPQNKKSVWQRIISSTIIIFGIIAVSIYYFPS